MTEPELSAKIKSLQKNGVNGTELDWRQNLKMGDPVTMYNVCGSVGGSVMRTTATQIIIVVSGIERRYAKSTGRRIAPRHLSGWIVEPEVTK